MYINELSLNLTSSCITFDLTTPEKNNIRMLEPIWMFTKVKPNWDCAIIADNPRGGRRFRPGQARLVKYLVL